MQNSNAAIASFNNPLIRFIADKKFRWLRHTLFILIGLILAFKGDIGIPTQVDPKVKRAILILDSITFIYIMGLLYLMLQVLIPKLLFGGKIFLFILSFFMLIVLIYVGITAMDIYIMRPVDPENKLNHVHFSVMGFIQLSAVCAVLLGSVLGLKVFKKWINDVQRMNELQQANLKTELEQLKSQINPHFLFNTLNNLLVLTKTNPEKATQVLLGLSDLLRYQLYDSTKETILLSKDIAFIKNLLELEKIRKNDFEYTINTEGRVDGQNLPPFLFIAFVENAIKHGSSTVGRSYLQLNFNITDNKLHFRSENSKPPIKNNMIGGIGLGNIKRRLELLYPGNHTLDIKDEADKYIVNLTIPL